LSLRKFVRLAGVVAVLFPLATCTDFTGPSGRGVRIPVAPTFSPAANFAKALYSSAGIEFDRVRVLVVRGESEILKDTTVAFSPTSPELTLPLVVSAAPGEVVQVTLEYRNPDVVLYSGTATVTTQPIAVTTASTTPIVLLPVGPGAAAETIQISPNGGTFPTTAAVPFTAQAFTADGASIANAIFGWSVDDETIATVNPQGVLQPTTKGGTVHVRATTLNAKFAEAAITFATAPASLAVQSGGNQSAMSFEPLPANVVVKVLDVNGNGVPGATVNFAVLSGGGTITVLNEISDAAGLASVKWTLGDVVGTQSITATATALPDAPLTISATGTERSATALAFVQQPTKSLMGAAIMPAVTVKAIDDKGRTVSGFELPIAITFEANPTSATLAGSASKNAVAGVATFSDLSVDKAGTGYTLKATANGLTSVISASFDVDQVPSGLSLFAGGSQTGVIRSTLSPIAVKVADANGIGVAGVTVSFSTAAGNGTVAASAITDASGIASVTWTLGNTIGAQSMTATVEGLTGSPLTIGATGTALPAVGVAFVQEPSNVVMNEVMTPAVTVRAVDVDGNTVTGYTGTIALTLLNNPNSATLGGTVSAAASAGVATFSNLTVSIAGSGYALKATSGTLTDATSSTFIVSPPVPVGLAFQVQPSNLLAGGTITPAVTVRIVDANGATVPGATNAVTIGLSNPLLDVAFFGTKTVNAVNGVATFSDLTVGTVISGLTLKVTSSGLATATSTAFDIGAPPTPSRAWTGAVSTDWHDAANWNPAGVPNASDSVTIAAGTNQPVMSATASAYVIVIGAGNSLRVNVPELSVLASKIVNQGTLWVTSGFFTGDVDNRNGGWFKVDGVAGAINVTNASGALTQVIGTTTEGTALVVGHGFTNDGTLDLTDVGHNLSAMSVGDSLVNHSGATINAAAGDNGERLLLGVLRNYGTVNVPTSRGLALTLSAGNSVNAGAINFTGGGPFTLYGSDTTTTSFTNTSTGSITLNSSAWDIFALHLQLKAGTVSGAGVFTSAASQLDVDIARLPLRLHIDSFSLFSGDSLVIPAGVTREFLGSTLSQKVVVLGTLKTLLAEEGGTDFQNALSIKPNGIVEAEGNTSVGGTLSIGINATLRVNAVGEQRLFAVQSGFSNAGNIELTSTGLFETRIRVDGTLTNETSGTIAALGGFGGERIVEGTLDNKGAINVSANSYFTLLSKSTDNKNTGTITLEAINTEPEVYSAEHLTSFNLLPQEGAGGWMTNTGVIDVGAYRTFYITYPGKLTNGEGGLIAGTGTVKISNNGEIFATLENTAGTIAPGGPGKLGTLTVDGVWVLGTGTLDIDIAGPEQGSYDVLDAQGLTTLGGKLSARYLGGYQPGTNGSPQGAIIVGNPFLGSIVVDPDEWGHYVDGGFHMYYSPPPPPGAAKRPPAR
jgi:hypothetical protein